MVCVVGCWVGGDSMPCVFDDDDDYINVVGCYPACLMMMSLPRTATPHLGGPPTDVFASDLRVIMVMMIVLMMVTMVIVVFKFCESQKSLVNFGLALFPLIVCLFVVRRLHGDISIYLHRMMY